MSPISTEGEGTQLNLKIPGAVPNITNQRQPTGQKKKSPVAHRPSTKVKTRGQRAKRKQSQSRSSKSISDCPNNTTSGQRPSQSRSAPDHHLKFHTIKR